MESEQKKSSNILFIIIAVLLFLLVIETGLLVAKLSKGTPPNRTKTTAIKSKSSPTSQQSQSNPQPVMPPIAIAYDPFSSFPASSRTRRAQHHSYANSSVPNNFSDMENPFAAMQRIQDRMNHLFDTAFMNAQNSDDNLINNSKIGTQPFDLEPPADIQDDGNNYIIKSDMPGLEKDKINIDVSGTKLSISGTRESIAEKKDESTGFVSQERSYGSFSKTVSLPGPVDETKVVADYKNGVLTIKLPKIQTKTAQQKVAVQ